MINSGMTEEKLDTLLEVLRLNKVVHDMHVQRLKDEEKRLFVEVKEKEFKKKLADLLWHALQNPKWVGDKEVIDVNQISNIYKIIVSKLFKEESI